MRLESIQLHNFGPYADVTLDLRQVASCTVSGPNGGGKSTLVSDGVLWCLFGECRAETDAFIRLGTTEMSAAVVFTTNGQRYRATRTRSVKTKRGKSDFQLTVHSGEEWKPVERSLSAILNAEYDVVTASNFITQDDPFDLCKAKPAQRIGLLSDILDIAKYTEDAKRAVRQGNLAEGELTSLVGQLEEKRQAVERYRQAAIDLAAAEQELAVLTAELAQAHADLEAGTKRTVALEATIQAMPAEEVSYLETQVALLATGKDRLEAKVAELKGLAGQEASLLEKQEALNFLGGTRDVLIADQQAARDLIDQADQAVQQAQAAMDELNKRGATIQQQRADIRVELVKARGQLADGERWVERYQADTQAITTAIAKAEKQTALLTTVPCGEDLQARCGFTKAAVAIKTQELPTLLEQQAERATDRAAILKLCPINMEAVGATIADLEAQDAALATQGRELVASGAAIGLEAQMEAKREAVLDLKNAEALLQRLEQQREALQAQLADLPKVQHAQEALPGVQQDLETKVAELAKAQQALDHARAHVAKKADLERQLVDVRTQHSVTQFHLRGLQDLQQACTIKQAHAQATLTQTCEAEAEAQALDKRIGALKAAMQEYHWLAEAYKRVPVLMIDNAIPVVEREANLALQQLSARGMTLRFETQKALKTVDKLVDELNIIVRDQAGERPYETYSGGERGLANFATRLGLSALTSTRSGARLETLVIDEAFASLDESVSERMRAFLGTLPEKFPLVIVITHDAGFKGTLGSQIVVSPGPQGSTVEVCA